MNEAFNTGPLDEDSLVSALFGFPAPFRTVAATGTAMRKLLREGQAELPRPGAGETLTRWRALAAVGGYDLSLAKIYEGHTDAVAILAELGAEMPSGLSAVWAAESPESKVTYRAAGSGGTISGQKAWCSGAAVVDHAVVTVWRDDGRPALVQVQMHQGGTAVDASRWQAVGMAACESATVTFANVSASLVGEPGAYVGRPGFWQGGAGIAAVWYGGAVAIARKLAASRRVANDAHAAAHLGAVETALRATRALLVETAAWIDAHPEADACAAALRVRASVESTAQEVLRRTGQALGPGPLCGDAAHAQRCADLPVFLRQSHAEHDLAALGQATAEKGARAWPL